MAYAEVNGCRLWYEIKGSGEHLLQIGGSAFGHLNFPPQFTEEMAKRFTVIETDQRGSGLSDSPAGKYTVDLWAEDYAAFLDALEIERVYVHGTSTGGMVAIKLAATRPDLVAGLIVGATAAKLDAFSRAQMEVRKALGRAYGMDSEVLALFNAIVAVSRDFLDSPEGPQAVKNISHLLGTNLTVDGWCAACDAAAEADLRDDLPLITVPTLVTSGELDNNMPLDPGPSGAGTRYIAEHIPGAQLHILKGCGHTSLMERPEESVEVVLDFLERARAAA
jgi:3-oxoadipate enol-lactonase